MQRQPAPSTFQELVTITNGYREEIFRNAKGLKWCWITEWSEDQQVYRLGVKYEGQTTWTEYCVLQYGYGEQAYQWIERLNEMEGISPDEHRAIWFSGKSAASVCLSEDEDEVHLLIRGTAHQFDRDGRCTFDLEYDWAFQVFRGLHLLNTRYLLPSPDEDENACVVGSNDTNGDVALSIPGEYERDLHDKYVFTLAMSLQTAADLLQAMPDEFRIDIAYLEEPEDGD